MLQNIIDYWTSKGNPENSALNGLRQSMLSNFQNNGNQYGSGSDAISSSYPWMPSLGSAMSAVNQVAPNVGGQNTPMGQLMQMYQQQQQGQQGQGQPMPAPNLRNQLLNFNQLQSAQPQAQTTSPVDNTVRGYTTPPAAAPAPDPSPDIMNQMQQYMMGTSEQQAALAALQYAKQRAGR